MATPEADCPSGERYAVVTRARKEVNSARFAAAWLPQSAPPSTQCQSFELDTKAMRLLSGDQLGVLIDPWPP